MIVDAVRDACRGLRLWDRRRIAVAVAAAAGSAVVIGVATVLIPNSLFARDIPPVWWDYPVWILTAVLIGMLIASYVRGPDVEAERRSGVLGGAGGILGWFAVGCPVCNKIALLALGYTGALTYFAPLQPILAALSIVLLVVAVIIRLKGQYACPVPSSERSVRS
ncbi:hypothetical protein [Brevibacterium sp. SMBL_HHYL_HB1]|uniref:hypothetical protein n=1 Tax=Brevibacterium sp. SMBL_HHYL_HB1 TaxID=2777556 RepID=UPI001BA82291|nr:hypothetical protein [Brevibacterium sp. SMBL_HHYL_HB1]QUL79573.1 hypothetical protein IG171_01340 [Brevibacterium sp. SMBL_HHYL_HB1]